jgi:uncharacterized protein YggU (UPF0235/DUF167 family)
MSQWYLKVRLTLAPDAMKWKAGTAKPAGARDCSPCEGQANEACRELLSKALDIPKSAIVLVQGAHSRDKVFRIEQGEPDIVGRFRRQ